jgi:hypothetical protein
MGIDLFGQQDFRKFHFGGYKLALSSITFGGRGDWEIFKTWEKLKIAFNLTRYSGYNVSLTMRSHLLRQGRRLYVFYCFCSSNPTNTSKRTRHWSYIFHFWRHRVVYPLCVCVCMCVCVWALSMSWEATFCTLLDCQVTSSSSHNKPFARCVAYTVVASLIGWVSTLLLQDILWTCESEILHFIRDCELRFVCSFVWLCPCSYKRSDTRSHRSKLGQHAPWLSV